MDKSEKRFERDIEAFLISPEGGYVQFNGQDAEGNWIHNRQHDISKCIYMDVLCEFIAKTQPKEWAKYTKYYGDNAADKLYHRLETTISNQGLLYVLRNGIEDMGCKLKVCYFKPESDLNPIATERYEANILGCTRQFRYTTANSNTIDMALSVNGIPVVALELKNQLIGITSAHNARQLGGYKIGKKTVKDNLLILKKVQLYFFEKLGIFKDKAQKTWGDIKYEFFSAKIFIFHIL